MNDEQIAACERLVRRKAALAKLTEVYEIQADLCIRQFAIMRDHQDLDRTLKHMDSLIRASEDARDKLSRLLKVHPNQISELEGQIVLFPRDEGPILHLFGPNPDKIDTYDHV